MSKKEKVFGIKCGDGYLVNGRKQVIAGRKKDRGEMKRFVKKLKKQDSKYRSCRVVDITGEVN